MLLGNGKMHHKTLGTARGKSEAVGIQDCSFVKKKAKF